MSTLDLNNLILAGIYPLSSTTTILNGPSFTGDATLIVALPKSIAAGDIQQTIFTQDYKAFIRTYNNPTWGAWGLLNDGGDPALYSVIHTMINYQFLIGNITVILDADSLIGTLPSADIIIPGVTYTLILGNTAITGTLSVPTGQSLNGTVNGTFMITGANNSISAQSDGINWFTV